MPHLFLLEPGKHQGGMVARGLSWTDVNRQEHVIGAGTLAFFKVLALTPIGWNFELLSKPLTTW